MISQGCATHCFSHLAVQHRPRRNTDRYIDDYLWYLISSYKILKKNFVLAIGLESQESDCTRAPRTRDPIIGEATFRPQSVTERATLTSRQMWAKFRLIYL